MARPATSTSRLLAGSREPCRVATTVNINPAAGGLLTIDGVALEPGDRVLVKNQADKRLNGIYGVGAGEWYRASDARSPRAINKGVTVHVAEGTVHEGQTFAFLTPEPVIGTDEIVIGFFLSYDTVGDAESAIEETAEDAVEQITDIANEAIAEVDQESAEAVARVIYEGDTQVARVEQEGNEQVYRVEEVGAAISGIASPLIIAENTFGTKGSVELWNPETPPDYVRTAGHSTAGDGGGALYKMVAIEPTHEGKIQSADGTWWELTENEVTLEMFGGRADGAYGNLTVLAGAPHTGWDNWPAFQAALGYGLVNNAALYGATATIHLLRGKYLVGQTLHINHNVRISGFGGAGAGNASPVSELLFQANTMGIKFWDPTAPGTPAPTYASGSILENLRVIGRGGSDLTGTVVNQHGVWSTAQIQIRDVTVTCFCGDGIHITQGGAPVASASNFSLNNIRTTLNARHGIFVDGDNSNAGGCVGIDSASNGGWGLWDSSFLGCTWSQGHTTDNGRRTRVFHNGKRYYCLSDTLGGSTEPGTNPLVWEYFEDGAWANAWRQKWTSGYTYVSGGPYCVDSPNAASLLIGSYAESDQGPSRIASGTLYMGGLVGPGSAPVGFPDSRGTGLWLPNAFGVHGKWATNFGLYYSGDPGVWTRFGIDDNHPIELVGTEDHAFGVGAVGWTLGYWDTASKTYSFRHNNVALRTALVLTSEHTTTPMNAGRGAGLLAGNIAFPNGIFTGSNIANTRMISNSAGVPAGPEFAKGDIAFNVSPDSGENVGWICTQGGVATTTPLWVSGTNYTTPPAPTVKNSVGQYYRLIEEPGARSIDEPSHTDTTGATAEADGFRWTYLCEPSATPDWVSGTTYAAGAIIKGGEPSPTGIAFRCHIAGPGQSTIEPTNGWQSGKDYGLAGSRFFTYGDGYVWEHLISIYEEPWEHGKQYLLVPFATTSDKSLAMTSSGRGYRCTTIAAAAIPSVDEPTHSNVVAAGVDGYVWTYLYEAGGGIITEPQPWVSGTNYALNDIRRNDGKVYQVTTDGPGTSTVPPTHSNEVTYGDGHRWHYLGTTTYVWKTFGLVDA